MNEAGQTKRLIKFLVNQDEHDVIRLAEAVRRTSMADFARLIVLEEAKRVTSEMRLPNLETGDKQPAGKRRR